jgi:4-hydroxy-4-methyl-2-oxoglutarate aldolase
MYTGTLLHPHQMLVYKSIPRPERKHIEAIANTYTGFVVDRVGKHGVLDSDIKPLRADTKMCGPAITVLGPDLAVRRAAADIAEPGDVLVIAARQASFACFGDGTARKMRLAGVHGVVIDGFTRDARRIAALNFHCFCRGSTLSNFDYPVFGRYGAINVPVSCGNTIVNPGDIIFGDADGVLVIPRRFVPDLATNLAADFLAETRERLSLKPGYSFNELDTLRDRGYEINDGCFPGD